MVSTTKTRLRILLIPALVGALFGEAVAAPAATDRARAKQLFSRAQEQFAAERWGEALKLYRQAHQLDPLPAFLFNMAQCLRKLGECRLAVRRYDEYLKASPAARNRATVEKYIAECGGQVGARPSSSGASDGRPPGSQRGGSPAGQPTPAGSRDSGEGEKTAAAAPPPGGSPPPGAGGAGHAPGARGKRTDDERRGGSAALLWTGVALTGACAIAAAVTGGVAFSMRQEYKDPETSIPDREDLRATGVPLATTTYVMIGVASAAAVGTLLYYLLGYRSSDSSAHAASSSARTTASSSPALVPLRGGALAGWQGSW